MADEYRCRDCGGKMEEINPIKYRCEDCGLRANWIFGDLVFDGDIDYVDDDEIVEDDDYDSKSPACVACGNPAYPECQTSCPLYDD